MKLWQQSVVEGRYVMSYQLSSTQWRQVESFLPGRPAGWALRPRITEPSSTASPVFTGAGSVGAAQRRPVERLAPGVWQLEKRPQTFHPLGQVRNLERIFQVLLDDPDNRYVMIDSTIVRAHQQAVCGKGGAKVRLWAAPAAD